MRCTNTSKASSFVCNKWVSFQSINYIDEIFAGNIETASDLSDAVSSGKPQKKAIDQDDLVRRSFIGRNDQSPDSHYDNMELNLVELLDDVLRPDKLSVIIDLKVDDRDLKEAPNFYKYCFSKFGPKTKPFSRQLWLGVKLFHEYCYAC